MTAVRLAARQRVPARLRLAAGRRVPARLRLAAGRRVPARLRLPARLCVPARLRGHGRDRGQASIEFLGFLPILLVIGLAVVQLGIAAFAVQQAGTGARAAARTASMDQADQETDPVSAGRAAMGGWGEPQISVAPGADEVSATVRVRIPSIVPGVGNFGYASRSATMPLPQKPGALGLRAAATYEGAPPR
ncbi:TadE/TadG family type IV pilus assembly protein [Streptomyces sp. NPDC054765]